MSAAVMATIANNTTEGEPTVFDATSVFRMMTMMDAGATKIAATTTAAVPPPPRHRCLLVLERSLFEGSMESIEEEEEEEEDDEEKNEVGQAPAFVATDAAGGKK